MRETKPPNHQNHGRALGDSFLALGGGAVTQWGGLGDSFLALGGRAHDAMGFVRGGFVEVGEGSVTQWALRAGISTNTGGGRI